MDAKATGRLCANFRHSSQHSRQFIEKRFRKIAAAINLGHCTNDFSFAGERPRIGA